jgi:hypothetical protein
VVIGWSWAVAWLIYAALLQVVAVIAIAVQVYRSGRDFGGRRMRAIRWWLWMRGRMVDAWRRAFHRQHVVQVAGSANMVMGSLKATVTALNANDSPTEAEFRRRLGALEVAQQQTSAAAEAHSGRLDAIEAARDDLQRQIREQATAGLLVQAWNVALVVVGIAIAAAAPWLGQVGVRGLPVVLAPVIAGVLVS